MNTPKNEKGCQPKTCTTVYRPNVQYTWANRCYVSATHSLSFIICASWPHQAPTITGLRQIFGRISIWFRWNFFRASLDFRSFASTYALHYIDDFFKFVCIHIATRCQNCLSRKWLHICTYIYWVPHSEYFFLYWLLLFLVFLFLLFYGTEPTIAYTAQMVYREWCAYTAEERQPQVRTYVRTYVRTKYAHGRGSKPC